MAEITLQIESSRALKIALELRGIEWVLESVVEGALPEEERSRDRMGRRQDQLMHLVRMFEKAVKDQTPPPPKHERPKQNSKTVWCSRPGCDRALTREQAKISSACLVCRLEDEKKPAAK